MCDEMGADRFRRGQKEGGDKAGGGEDTRTWGEPRQEQMVTPESAGVKEKSKGDCRRTSGGVGGGEKLAGRQAEERGQEERQKWEKAEGGRGEGGQGGGHRKKKKKQKDTWEENVEKVWEMGREERRE